MDDKEFQNSGEEAAYSGESAAGSESTAYASDEAMIEEGKAAAILGYVPFLCFVPLIKMRHNKFAFRHGKQGLVLLMIEILAIFFMFDIISNLFWGIMLILAIGSAIFGILYSLQGKEFTLPFIGQHIDRLKI